jgi:RNA-splicing ligase RtcB
MTAIFGRQDEATLAQLRDVASRAERAALMADGHLGYVMAIGGVAAYRTKHRLLIRSFVRRADNGTVGSGNHYVDVFADETGRIWVGVHFGSRGFGHAIASARKSISFTIITTSRGASGTTATS